MKKEAVYAFKTASLIYLLPQIRRL